MSLLNKLQEAVAASRTTKKDGMKFTRNMRVRALKRSVMMVGLLITAFIVTYPIVSIGRNKMSRYRVHDRQLEMGQFMKQQFGADRKP